MRSPFQHTQINLILHYRFFFLLSHLVAVGLLGGGGLGNSVLALAHLFDATSGEVLFISTLRYKQI